MTSRASLLAELEEKLIENNKKEITLNEDSLSIDDASAGYNPYDNHIRGKEDRPGKEIRDPAESAARRRRILKRYGRR